MRNMTLLVIGFLAGILVTSAFFHLRHLEAIDQGDTVDSTAQIGTSERQSELGNVDSAQSGEVANDFGDLRSPNRSNKISVRDSQHTDDYAVQLNPTGQSPPAENASSSIAGQRGNGSTRNPIPVADEIAPFFEDGSSAADFHNEMESEERDESWAQYIEAQISAYLASKPSLANFQIALIHCRTSMCEVQAVGYGPEAEVIWFAAIADMPDQPWAYEFGGGDGTFEMRQFGPDVVSILMQLARQKSDSTVNSVETVISHQ